MTVSNYVYDEEEKERGVRKVSAKEQIGAEFDLADVDSYDS